MDQEKEYVSIYVGKDIADQLRKSESMEFAESVIKKIIEKKRLDLTNEYDALDDDMVKFKAVCLVHRNTLKKVYEEQTNKLDNLFYEMDSIQKKTNEHAKRLAESVIPIRGTIDGIMRDVCALKKQIEGMSLYIPENLARLATVVSQMDDKTKSILSALLAKGI